MKGIYHLKENNESLWPGYTAKYQSKAVPVTKMFTLFDFFFSVKYVLFYLYFFVIRIYD